MQRMSNDEPSPIDPPRTAGQPFARQGPEPSNDADARARVAAIDVGSNAIRFLAGTLDGAGGMETLAFDRAAVRLGHDVFVSGHIGPAIMDATVAALVRFRRRMDELDITRYRAVATSAVRDSANGSDLVDRVRGEAGIVLETISGTEEAELVHRAVRSRVPMKTRPWLLIDIGGGSVEITLADRGGILETASHAAGAVRLLEQHGSEDVDALRHAVEARAAALPLPQHDAASIEGVVATGGNSDALADLNSLEADEQAASRLTLDALHATIERLAAASIEERMSWGLRADRADVILPAAIIYEQLCRRAGCDALWIPRVGVREGVILDVAKHRSVGRITSD